MRSQIGDVLQKTLSNTANQIYTNYKTIKPGSLVIVMTQWVPDFGAYCDSITDSTGRYFKKVIEYGTTDGVYVHCAIAYYWNHPGGYVYFNVNFSDIVLSSSSSMVVIELTGGDTIDPFFGVRASIGTTTIEPIWAHAPVGAESFGVLGCVTTPNNLAVGKDIQTLYQPSRGLYTRMLMPFGTARHVAKVTQSSGSTGAIVSAAATFRSPYPPKRKIITSTSASLLPTLSNGTYVPDSLTTTGWRPRVTAVFP